MKKLIVCFLGSIVLLHGMEMTETNEAFISRSKSLPGSRKCKSKVFVNIDDPCPFFQYFIEPRGACLGFYVTCPYNVSKALLRPSEETSRKTQLVILTGQSDVYARHFLSNKQFIAVALAARRDLFATIHKTPQCEILKIRRVDTKKTLKKIAIPTYFELACATNANSVIAFNKQGTDIIVWGSDARYNQPCTGTLFGVPAIDYMIFNFIEEIKAEKDRQQKKYEHHASD